MTSTEFPNLADCHVLFDALPNALLVIRTGVIVFCNLSAVRLFHAKDETGVIGKNHEILSSTNRSMEEILMI